MISKSSQAVREIAHCRVPIANAAAPSDIETTNVLEIWKDPGLPWGMAMIVAIIR
jgi:hypothetical protein